MKKVLFIDRDGTIIAEPDDEQIDCFEKLEFIPGAICGLARISRELDFELVMVTNQDGLGTTSFPEETFWPAHNKMLQILRGEGVIFREIFIDRSLPEDKAPSRKPGTAMLTGYLAGGVDLSSSYVIGDRPSDMKLAENLGCNGIFFSREKSPAALLNTTSWNEICNFLKSKPRRARVERKTTETSVIVELNLDGSGKSNIRTGIGFFDHMLEQIARHGETDLSVSSQGDLRVDEHHTIEDVAICLGEAIRKALGSKKGIERYGFTLPMDDSLASVAVDFGNRPWLVWDVDFKREMIGEIPSEMFFHFFKSLSDSSRCNLNIKAEGGNEHHKIEAVFKAFAKAMRMAVSLSGKYDLPSTKGLL
jgi:imidazoleglycerol-phosphate dehydratase/histidinol-phosphatase